MKNRKNNLAGSILKGLNQAIEYEKGDLKARTIPPKNGGVSLEFLSDEHKKNFWTITNEDKNFSNNDIERTALFFIIAGSDELFLHRHDLYDFRERGIKINVNEDGPEIQAEPWHTSGTKALIRLAYNLYNGFDDGNCTPTKLLSSLDIENFSLALRAIQMRFNK